MKVFNHGPHIVLDVLTCGLWLPVHLLLWACAPTVPMGGASSSAAAAGSANTTIVFGGLGPQPHVFQTAHPQYGQTFHPPQAVQPYPPYQAQQPAPQLPGWAIEEARERLPRDAPWAVVESLAKEYVDRRAIEQPE